LTVCRDQTIHNYYFYNRDSDNKWFFLVWDADGLFELSAPTTSIYTASDAQRHHLRKNINIYLKPDYDSRMVTLPYYDLKTTRYRDTTWAPSCHHYLLATTYLTTYRLPSPPLPLSPASLCIKC
jgi:hypothetical protein